ncbi:MAG: DUF4038 domain-containing protein [Verrucomicrobiota bacterium]|nr:DUF4038 domain-containing protein [Verrucomicrobiota bacterium]
MNKLTVHSGHHHLQYENGSPFVYLGDTAWELFHRCSREDVDFYLRDRASKGFTVIQAVALAELDGIKSPNVYGDWPLSNDDPTQPNEAYFAHVDWVVNRANELGLQIGFLPTWGDKWNKGSWGAGPELFTPANAFHYGEWLGRRYKDADIIWILGGDRQLVTTEHVAIIRAMAEGLRKGDEGNHLITLHPMGGQSSSLSVHTETWLDFHMIQSGHQRDRDNYRMIEDDYLKLPARPVVEGEPGYEAHPNHFNQDHGMLDQTDVRKSCYWAFFAGAAGYTYGCHAVWQMWDGVRTPINGPRAPWKESLALPGAGQVQYARRLLESRPFFKREPAQWMLWVDARRGAEHLQCCRALDGSYAMVYIAEGNKIKVWPSKITGSHLHIWWYNPRNGTAVDEGLREIKDDNCHFLPPFDPFGRDWVLVLDDASKGYPAPGTPWTK